MKKIYLLISFCILFLSANCQELSAKNLKTETDSEGYDTPANWKLSTSNGNVDFYYRIDECKGQKAVFLKIVNSNNYDVQVYWKEVITDKRSGSEIEGFYGEKKLLIPAGTNLQANCNNSDQIECLTLATSVVPTHLVDIQDFKFKDIKVMSHDN